MKKFLFYALLITIFSRPAFAGTTDDVPVYVEGDVMVTLDAPIYEEGVDMDVYSQLLLDQAEAFASKYGLKVINIYPGIAKSVSKSIIHLQSYNKSTEVLISELSSDPDVISITPVDISYLDLEPVYVEGEVVVLLKAPVYEESISIDEYSQLLLDQAETFAKKYGLKFFGVPLTAIAIVSGKNIINIYSENKSTEQLIKELSSDPDLISVEPIYMEGDRKEPVTETKTEPKSRGGCNAGNASILFFLIGLDLLAINKK